MQERRATQRKQAAKENGYYLDHWRKNWEIEAIE